MAVRSALRRLRWIVLAFGIVLTVGCADGGDVDDFADLEPYLENGPYADLLVGCVNIEFADESCPFGELPLLGMEAPAPDVDDVMDRVVVSDGWMGVRFQQALQTLEPDILLLLRSVTAIVIDDDINPSFYWRATGAIYLDPYYLWTTNAEKATVSKEEDYRASFGDDLNFVVAPRRDQGALAMTIETVAVERAGQRAVLVQAALRQARTAVGTDVADAACRAVHLAKQDQVGAQHSDLPGLVGQVFTETGDVPDICVHVSPQSVARPINTIKATWALVSRSTFVRCYGPARQQDEFVRAGAHSVSRGGE